MSAAASRPLDRRIHLITGKGGVGRTTLAAAMAMAQARRGRRVLLAEVGDEKRGSSPIARMFGREELDEKPTEVSHNVFACQLSAIDGQEQFARSVIPAGPLIRAALRSQALRRFMAAPPAFHELGIFYHLLGFLKEHDRSGKQRFTCVVLDLPATGHALGLTAIPQIALRLVPKGPIAAAMREGQSFLNDPATAAAWVVSLPEQLPTTEALELIDGLLATNIPVAGVLMNRFVEDPFNSEERNALLELFKRQPMQGQLALRRIVEGAECVERLHRTVSVPVIRVPDVLDTEEEGPVPTLADALAGAMEAP